MQLSTSIRYTHTITINVFGSLPIYFNNNLIYILRIKYGCSQKNSYFKKLHHPNGSIVTNTLSCSKRIAHDTHFTVQATKLRDVVKFTRVHQKNSSSNLALALAAPRTQVHKQVWIYDTHAHHRKTCTPYDTFLRNASHTDALSRWCAIIY